MLAPLLLLLAQDVPADAVEEVVVTATIGYTTMLFDKGADGRLRNCRVMVSSGSNRRDTAACQAAPVCYARAGSDEAAATMDCVDMVVVDPQATTAARPSVFDVPKLVQPQRPRAASALGPIGIEEQTRDSEAQRVKLPPLPQAPKDRPVVTFRVGDRQAEEPR